MHIYKTFFKIAKKYLTSGIIYFTVFCFIFLGMSKLGNENSKTQFSASSVNFTVIDEDQTKASAALIDYLSIKHNYVEMNSYDDETLQDNLYYQTISYILRIPAGYEDKLINNNFDELVSHYMKTDSASGYFFNNDVKAYFDSISLCLEGGYSLEEAMDYTKDIYVEAAENDVDYIAFEASSNLKNDSIFYYFQYFSYVFISILLASISPILLAFHRKNLADRINCSAVPKRTQSLFIGLATLSTTAIIWLLLMIIAAIIMGPEILVSSTGLLCLLNSGVYALIIAAIALLVGSFTLDRNVLNLVSNIISLGSSFLCGVFVPMWMLDKKVQSVSQFLPTYWYIKNNNMLAGFSDDVFSKSSYFSNLGIELVFLFAILSVYLVVSKQRLKTS